MIAGQPGCHPRCKACAHKSLTVDDSLRQKSSFLHHRLGPWSEVLRPVRSRCPEEPFRYRDKVCLAASHDGTSWNIGTIRDEEVIPIPECPVHSSRVHSAMGVLLRHMPAAGLFPLAFYAQAGAQVTLVLKTRDLPDMSWLGADVITGLQAAGVEGLWLHLHPSAGHRIFLKTRWELVWGKGSSLDEQGLAYGPVSFRQLIPELHGESLDLAETFLAPGPGSAVVDLYCGNGASLRRWASRGAGTLGIELSGEAYGFALVNAPDAQLLRGKCSERIPQADLFLQNHAGMEKLLYVNPPRTGLEPAVTGWICSAFRPRRIAYLSCSAGTLSRDLALLEEAGYGIRDIIPFDFFPYTQHVECLALLELR